MRRSVSLVFTALLLVTAALVVSCSPSTQVTRPAPGIEGDAIPLDSPDPRFRDYLAQVRERIKAGWAYPCLKSPQTQQCEYRSAQLIVEIGILRSGQLDHVTVVRSSGIQIYDDYAMNAVRQASPFPPVPDTVLAAMNVETAGVRIAATFNYVAEPERAKGRP